MILKWIKLKEWMNIGTDKGDFRTRKVLELWHIDALTKYAHKDYASTKTIFYTS